MNFPQRIFPVFVTVLLATAALAQNTPENALEAANSIYNSGDYPSAAKAYAALLRDYPTSPSVPSAQVQLAYSRYLTGENQSSLDALKEFFNGPPAGGQLTELASLLEPQVLSALAASLPPDDPRRRSAQEDAVKKFAKFVQNYPKSDEIESAIYGSALASFQGGDYAAAQTSLEANLQRFSQSISILESQNLLALTLATQGSKMLAGDEADQAAAFLLYTKATDLLRDIIAQKSDLALINTAQFQLGEILLSEAAAAPEERRSILLEEARSSFRQVLPKNVILSLQQQKIDAIPAARAEALRSRDKRLLARTNRQAERDRRKFSELEALPDQSVTALEKVGESYFQGGEYDASRVVLSHVSPLLTQEDDQKRNLYYTTMTYALQNAAAQATAGYEAFQEEHRGDPLAVNLPVALGNLYLTHPNPAKRDPQRAALYFRQAAEIYPQSPLLGLAVVNEATARSQQGDYDGALETYQSFLATNPPAEVAAVAQLGIGNVLKEQGKWDQAIPAYRKLTQKYPEAAQVEEAEFWIALGTQEKGDNENALTLLSAFIQKYPKSKLAPSALYASATAQLGLGRQREGIATMTEIAEKYPDSQPAPFTYFQRAQLAGADEKPEEVIRLMTEFPKKYPEDDKVFFAFDSVGQTEISRGNLAAAITAYRNFVERYRSDPRAPEALLKTADLHRVAAEKLGRYEALSAEEQKSWKASLAGSIAAVEEMVTNYPESRQLGEGLRSLLASKDLELSDRLTDQAGVKKYFDELGESAPDTAKSKILFAQATFIHGTEPSRGLEAMDRAYNKSLVYAPADLDLYGLALLQDGKLDEAQTVFTKIATDYPTPAGQEPSQAPPAIQEAQAIALFGLGRIAQEEGKLTEAGEAFTQLKSLYPWSPKVLEANYGIAAALRDQGKNNQAIMLLTQIIRAPNAPAELRADAMLLGGYIQKDEKEDGAAIDYFIKISAFYEGVPKAASTGLWEGGQLLEKQVAELQSSDPEKAKKQRDQAIRAYRELTEKFPDSPFVPQAQARLSALGAP